MIVFEFDIETHNSDRTLKQRPIYWLGGVSCPGDEENEDEIYEQLAAEESVCLEAQ